MKNKTIHYCWFGGAVFPEHAKKSIESWSQFAPHFDVKEWNEENFDVLQCSFVAEAYEAKNYAFVSDYARLKIMYDNGGIYMDVGSELIQDIEALIHEHAPLIALENQTKTASSGLIFACEPANPLIYEALQVYHSINYDDSNEFREKHTTNKIISRIFEKRGFLRKDELQIIDGWTILPTRYFDPLYSFGGHVLGDDTYSVHYSSGSWISPQLQYKKKFVQKFAPYLGRRLSQIFGRVIGEIKHEGMVKGLRKLWAIAKQKM